MRRRQCGALKKRGAAFEESARESLLVAQSREPAGRDQHAPLSRPPPPAPSAYPLVHPPPRQHHRHHIQSNHQSSPPHLVDRREDARRLDDVVGADARPVDLGGVPFVLNLNSNLNCVLMSRFGVDVCWCWWLCWRLVEVCVCCALCVCVRVLGWVQVCQSAAQSSALSLSPSPRPASLKLKPSLSLPLPQLSHLHANVLTRRPLMKRPSFEPLTSPP